MRGESAVLRAHRPFIVRVGDDFLRSDIDHRLDGDDHAGHEEHTGVRLAIVADERRRVKHSADSVPAEDCHDRISVGSSHGSASRADIADEMPRLDRADAFLHDLACDVDEPLSLGRGFAADDVHSRGVGEIAVEIGGDVDVDDVARLKNFVGGRNPVADDVIDRSADAFRKALEAEARRMSSMPDDVIMDGGIEAQRVEPGLDQFGDQIERAGIDHRRFFYQLDLLGIVNEIMRRTNLAQVDIQIQILQPRIKIQMAFLIFFSAPAPARIISFHVPQPLLKSLKNIYQIVITLLTVFLSAIIVFFNRRHSLLAS